VTLTPPLICFQQRANKPKDANDIHCSSENTCVFAMEGLGAPRIMSTMDGGATWTTFEDPSGGSSLMTARMTGATEAWVAGGGDVGRVWHSTDLVNWDAYETSSSDAVSIVAFAMGDNGKTAFATGVLKTQICSVLAIQI
jgi:hypothetical protein